MAETAANSWTAAGTDARHSHRSVGSICGAAGVFAGRSICQRRTRDRGGRAVLGPSETLPTGHFRANSHQTNSPAIENTICGCSISGASVSAKAGILGASAAENAEQETASWRGFRSTWTTAPRRSPIGAAIAGAMANAAVPNADTEKASFCALFSRNSENI